MRQLRLCLRMLYMMIRIIENSHNSIIIKLMVWLIFIKLLLFSVLLPNFLLCIISDCIGLIDSAILYVNIC